MVRELPRFAERCLPILGVYQRCSHCWVAESTGEHITGESQQGLVLGYRQGFTQRKIAESVEVTEIVLRRLSQWQWTSALEAGSQPEPGTYCTQRAHLPRLAFYLAERTGQPLGQPFCDIRHTNAKVKGTQELTRSNAFVSPLLLLSMKKKKKSKPGP